ncbi:MAG: glycosyltransferase family 2 protein [Opitutaceae bacterium]|nr:glycosyltransferase family 2 protein [Opitutaceae bacterium]
MQAFHDVSIVIVSPGPHPYLERCVRSCVAQTYPGRSYEILILHDGKSLTVEDVIANYGKRREVASHLTEMTPAAILTTVLRNTTGRFLVFVDPDDFISDYMILFQTVFLYDNAGCGGVSVDRWLVEADTDRKIAREAAQEKPLLAGTMFRKDLLVKLTRSEGVQLGYDPARLREILARNSAVGHLPVAFYRKSVLRAPASG